MKYCPGKSPAGSQPSSSSSAAAAAGPPCLDQKNEAPSQGTRSDAFFASRRSLSSACAASPSFPLLPRGSSLFCSSTSAQDPGGTFVEHMEDDDPTNGSASQPCAAISVDRSALYNPPEHSHEPTADSELVKHLKGIVKFRGGPISVAKYMEEVLTNPKARFYINHDVFGAEGDFITSPEVSQMFGEMFGVWTMCMWEQMGRPSRVNLVELGPGRGTLMADLLRGTSKFKQFTGALHVHMVHCSPTLRKLQHSNLKCIEEENV
ncbi:hypothetical protein NL676_021420 [Syzygium grande]|nr:hypothetical protein NL676_021420 [Syzygium grande]